METKPQDLLKAQPGTLNKDNSRMRISCLELALRMPDHSGPVEVVRAAMAFEAYLLGVNKKEST